MDFKVGVVSKGKLTGEILRETKRALEEIALKYKCRFELSTIDEEEMEKSVLRSESNFKAHLKNNGENIDGVYLSFGGELEMD